MDHDKRIDRSVEFVAVSIAILTISDSRKAADDRSGDLLAGRINEDGHHLAGRAIVTDDFDAIIDQLRKWIDDDGIDVIVSTGGTGLTGRDGTPEAFRAIFEKEIEGFGELFRYISFAKIGTSTVQSRAVAGVAGGTYCSRCPDRHRRAAMDGMKSFAISSIFVIGHATLLKLCRGLPNRRPSAVVGNA